VPLVAGAAANWAGSLNSIVVAAVTICDKTTPRSASQDSAGTIGSICVMCRNDTVTRRSYTGFVALGRARPMDTVLCPTIASSGCNTS
jgi:hypothetical protein